jgi:hypothetical protein
MTKEALKLALEALEVANSCVDGYYIPKGKTHLPEIELAIIAIKEALANEALDKMAENARELGLDYYVPCCTDKTCPKCKAALEAKAEPVAIYRAGQTKGEVYHVQFLKEMAADEMLLYAVPVQRAWTGLTDEEVKNFVQAVWPREATPTDYIRAIEAKLKEKNT